MRWGEWGFIGCVVPTRCLIEKSSKGGGVGCLFFRGKTRQVLFTDAGDDGQMGAADLGRVKETCLQLRSSWAKILS